MCVHPFHTPSPLPLSPSSSPSPAFLSPSLTPSLTPAPSFPLTYPCPSPPLSPPPPCRHVPPDRPLLGVCRWLRRERVRRPITRPRRADPHTRLRNCPSVCRRGRATAGASDFGRRRWGVVALATALRSRSQVRVLAALTTRVTLLVCNQRHYAEG